MKIFKNSSLNLQVNDTLLNSVADIDMLVKIHTPDIIFYLDIILYKEENIKYSIKYKSDLGRYQYDYAFKNILNQDYFCLWIWMPINKYSFYEKRFISDENRWIELNK